MFELTSLWTSILIIFCGVSVIFSIIFPLFVKLRKVYLISIRLILVSFFITWIVLLSEVRKDSYFLIGSFLGIAFVLEGLFKSNELSAVYYLLSYLAFTFIFLSIGQTFLFILNLSFTYILSLGLTAYHLYYQDEKEFERIPIKAPHKILISILVTFFVVLFGLIIYYTSSEQVVNLEKSSLVNFFLNNPTLPFFIFFILAVAIIIVVIFSLDIYNNSKKETDKSWFS